ncbi:hypothetical protein PVAND_008900 [Polypedilum vanderplanki]|uniref:EGF-like domain-containing protein n=1 Tax=Polypedilum vanderplanki TaxID=319348 RepID=A0A9J6CBT2_POLVA|nr:hypothetical protein PVAND_008900 [Polypedilum vanderplanki]
MWVKDFVKFALLLQFFILSTSSSLHLNENETESLGVDNDDTETLPSIWEDEVVTRMVREVIARDLVREHEFKRSKRQYKRDVHSSVTLEPKAATSNSNRNTQTTRKMTLVSTQKGGKKPVKVTQSGNKNKNRVTSASTTTTKATVKPSARPNISLGTANGSVKIKPTTAPTKYHYYPHNQHPYFLPECAIQQVCNAVYVRLNYTQPLCVCPPSYNDGICGGGGSSSSS